jgi:dihydroxy-acid dehydratase
MGTASSMAILTEVLGMSLPGCAGLAALSEELESAAYQTGRRVTEMAAANDRPSTRVGQPALDNAIKVLAAVGGSTNAIIHLAAIAGRLGLQAGLERMDTLWRSVPLLADIEPCGTGLIFDFQAAGGVPTLARGMSELFDGSTVSGDGRAWREVTDSATPPAEIIRTVDDPVAPAPTMAAVFGTLAPQGAILKVAAASPHLLNHSGRAIVFDDYEDMRARLDDENLDVAEGDVIVVRNCGPVGVPGMPEWGMAPIPKRLVERGVRDMLRISDGRMSGTSFGTVLLHVSPESAVGGPLGLVQDGDQIRLDFDRRALDLLVDGSALKDRAASLSPATSAHRRGWPLIYQQHVQQAPLGCDLDFLVGNDADSRRFIEPVVGRS